MSVESSEAVLQDCYTGQGGEARGLVPTVPSFDIACKGAYRNQWLDASFRCIGGASRHHQIYGIGAVRYPIQGCWKYQSNPQCFASADESPVVPSRTDCITGRIWSRPMDDLPELLQDLLEESTVTVDNLPEPAGPTGGSNNHVPL
jgi:hypothetical protein